MTTLVTNFFSRKVTPEVVKPVEVEEVEVYESDYTNISTILGRDWFVDIDDIIDYLDELDENEYQYAWNTRDKYSWRVRTVIEGSMTKFGVSRIVKDITDKEMSIFEKKGVKELQQNLEVLWNAHRVECCVKRVPTETERRILDTNIELADVIRRKANHRPKFVPSWKVAEKDVVLEEINLSINKLSKFLASLEAKQLKEFVEWEESCKQSFLATFYNL